MEKSDNSVLADELRIVLKDIKLGSSRADSLRAMARRLDIPEVTSFVAVVIDADSTGASISQVLKDQSEQMRLERFVRAEKAGAQASQKMLIPMMMFILPALGGQYTNLLNQLYLLLKCRMVLKDRSIPMGLLEG